MVTSSKRTYGIPTPRASVHVADHCRPVPLQAMLTVLSQSLWGLSTTNWHLPRVLPMTEQQRCLPSASMETELHATIAADLQQPLREWSEGGVRHCVLQGI